MSDLMMFFLHLQLLFGISSTLVIHSIPWKVPCPHRCVCQIKPWYSPQSVYREAPTVDCNDLLLTQLPTSLPPETQTLKLQSNLISSVDQSELQGLTNLTELDLSHNSFFSTHNLRITDLPTILSLHLEENQLRHLPEAAFSGLSNLQELYLNHNRLKSISPGAFKGLGNLLRLHLNSNNLMIIDRHWFHALPQLEVLMTGGNPVDTIQDLNFKPLGSLRSLVLAGMGLREISERALEGLLNLESISFYENNLTKVPKEALQKLPALKFLDLNKNPIQLLQKGDFRDMLHLKELGLNNMDNLVSIEHSAMENLPELTKLEITNNPRLSYIHPQAFNKLPSMESLMINSNALSALHRQTVQSLPSLQEISLHTNPIRCDCLIRWVGAEDEKPVRFIEPQSTFCSEPPELKARRVKEVSFREMADSCLPLIAPSMFSSYIQVKHGENIDLHCRALAEPEPSIYWVIPKGLRLTPSARFGRYHVSTEGTLKIFKVTAEEAGFYTCVAQNLVGADTKSLTLKVEGSGKRAQITNYKSNDESLVVNDVKERYALLSLHTGHSIPAAQISWIANGSLQDHHKHSTRILAGTRGYNLTRLQPGTYYNVCLHMGPNDTSCVYLRTKEVLLLVPSADITAVFLLGLSALFLILLATKDWHWRKIYYWKEFKKPHSTVLTKEAKAFIVPATLLKNSLQKCKDKPSEVSGKMVDAKPVQNVLGPAKESLQDA